MGTSVSRSIGIGIVYMNVHVHVYACVYNSFTV